MDYIYYPERLMSAAEHARIDFRLAVADECQTNTYGLEEWLDTVATTSDPKEISELAQEWDELEEDD